MITFTILLIALLIFTAIATLLAVVGGTGIILIFGDLIICGAIIWLLIRMFTKKK